MIGKQKNEPNSCSSKGSSMVIRAVWTKNHPRRESTWTRTPQSVKSSVNGKVVHNNRPCSSSMDDLQMSMDDQTFLDQTDEYTTLGEISNVYSSY